VNEATKTTTTPAPPSRILIEMRIRIIKIEAHCNHHHDRHDCVILYLAFIYSRRCPKLLACIEVAWVDARREQLAGGH
jgi:hypothetical protein